MDLGSDFAIELGRVSRRWRVCLDERLKHTGLTQARWIILLHLSRGGVMSQRELAERVSVEGPTLVRALDRLEEQGLIARRACIDDRRIKHIHLTVIAGPILDEITRIAAGLRQELLADMSAEDLRTTWQTLATIGGRLERL